MTEPVTNKEKEPNVSIDDFEPIEETIEEKMAKLGMVRYPTEVEGTKKVNEKKELEEPNKVNKVLLAESLKELLVNNEELSKISIKLDDNIKACLMSILLTYPETFAEFDTLIELIVDDGKINMNDFSNILKLILKLHIVIKKTNIDYENAVDFCGIIFKFILHYLIKDKKIKLSKIDEEQVLLLTNELIDVALELLKQNDKIEKGCISFFKKLLCKSKKA
jgi:hypothetical protein